MLQERFVLVQPSYRDMRFSLKQVHAPQCAYHRLPQYSLTLRKYDNYYICVHPHFINYSSENCKQETNGSQANLKPWVTLQVV